jgi:hypothetical protein
MFSAVPLSMSITVSTRICSFSFILPRLACQSNIVCRRAALDNRNLRTRMRPLACNMDNVSTCRSRPAHATVKITAMFNLNVCSLARTRATIQPIPSAAAALDAVKLTVTDSSVPGDDVVDRGLVLLGLLRGWSSNLTTTQTEENVRPGHHCDPQQRTHTPLLCIGLHLSPVSPQILALSGAT